MIQTTLALILLAPLIALIRFEVVLTIRLAHVVIAWLRGGGNAPPPTGLVTDMRLGLGR
jgi:hypothetical protein